MENFTDISWLAVGLGTVVSFMVGWLWYSPKMFLTKWAEGSGLPPEPPEDMPAFAMAAQLCALLLLSLVIGITAAVNALITAILAILAAATFVVSNGAWCRKSGYALAVDFFYVVVSGVIMAVFQGLL